jgi:hypothetical protein
MMAIKRPRKAIAGQGGSRPAQPNLGGMMDPIFCEFIDKLAALQGAGGNCHFEWLLFEKIQASGKPIGQMTIDEFLTVHEAANSDYNEIAARIQGGR